MIIETLTLTGPLNTSLQVGDMVYYSPVATVPGSGFSTVTPGTIVQFGIIILIGTFNATTGMVLSLIHI